MPESSVAVPTGIRRHWTLAMAANYVISRGNPSETFVRVQPALSVIDIALSARVPTTPGAPINPLDPATFEYRDIICQDLDVTGMAWPEALAKLIEPHGFGFTWRLQQGPNLSFPGKGDQPDWVLHIYRKDDLSSVWSFGLQPPGQMLDPSKSNVTAADLTIDTTQIVNAFVVDSRPERFEASFVLAPLFEIDPGDAALQNPWTASSEEFQPNAYRLFGFDECGEGHWDLSTGTWVTKAGDLSALFRKDGSLDPTVDRTESRYVIRRRPPLRYLFKRDSDTKRRETARLFVCVEYPDTVPGLCNTQATGALKLREVARGGWELLDDRLGIRLTVDQVYNWNIGPMKPPVPAGTPFRAGPLNVVQALAAPSASMPRFVFILHCVIEGDYGIASLAGPTGLSPVSRGIWRRMDARDNYRKETVTPFRWRDALPKALSDRDDTLTARSHAAALQAAHEAAKVGGSVTVGRVVRAVRVGDKFNGILGRNASFSGSARPPAGGPPRVPTVVGIDWTFSPKVGTVYHLDDRRDEPVPPGREGDLEA
jgi:hypothetical protein